MGTRRRQPARLDDVARDAGVHVSTVSRVLNGRGDSSIRPETKQRILESAERLRYRPHALARGLRLAASGTIAIVGGPLRNPLWSQIIHAAFDRARERGYVVVLAEDSVDGVAADASQRLANEGRIDGLLVLSGNASEWLRYQIADSGFPTVFAGRGYPGSSRNVVMREDSAVRLALDYLVERGHTAIGYVEGPAELDTTRRRTTAFGLLWAERGLVGELVYAPHTERGGFSAVAEAIERLKPTACVVAGLNQVIGAMAAIRAARLCVPSDIDVITFDDDPLLDYLEGPPTSIRMPLHELGVAAVDALVAQISGDVPADIVLSTEPVLVVRR